MRVVGLQTPALVRCTCPEVAALLTVCYGELPRHHEPEDRCVVASCRRDAAGWTIEVAGRETVRAGDVEQAVRLLNHELLHGWMRRRPTLLYVHAAVVSVGNRAIVLPGLSRAGKSTLTLALLQRGAHLLSDELAAYDPSSGALLAFPRAPKLRDECTGYFAALAPGWVGRGEARFVPLAALARTAVAQTATAAVIVAPRWDAAGDDHLQPKTAGEALLWLAQSALNFGAHRVTGLDHLAALTRDAQHYAITWRDPHAAAARILTTLGDQP